MCTLRKNLGRHLTDAGVSAILAHKSGPHPLHPFFSDIPEQIQRSRPRCSRTAASRTTGQNPKTPSRGEELLTPEPALRSGQVQPAGSTKTRTACPDRSQCWVLGFATWREKSLITLLCMPTLTPYQAAATPATPLSAVGTVGVCYDKAKTSDCPDAASSLEC